MCSFKVLTVIFAKPATPDEEDEEEEPPAKKHKAEESDSDVSRFANSLVLQAVAHGADLQSD